MTSPIHPDLVAQFAPRGIFLNSATYGLAPASARAAMTAYDVARTEGTLSPDEVDDIVDSCRDLIGALFGRTGEEVAISASASQLIGTIAHSLPSGARVLLAEGDFTSVLFPFLSRDDLVTTVVAQDELVAGIEAGIDLVAVSAVQSVDGRVADLTGLAQACRRTGARLLLDVTQAAGWLPLHDVEADFVVGGGYKWLLAPRGTAYLTGTPEALATLRPLAANWYAGEERWGSIYGTPLRLAEGVRRLDLSPAWACWVGMEPALSILHAAGIDTIYEHNVGLANRFRAALDLPPSDSAIVSVELGEDAVARLAQADVRAAGRAGRSRFSFHLYNTEDDVDRAVTALG